MQALVSRKEVYREDALIKRNYKRLQSMSRKGNCWDNAVAESFFKTMKTEMIYHEKFETRAQARLAVFEYIEIWYNRERRHSSLGYLTPCEVEKLLQQQTMAA